DNKTKPTSKSVETFIAGLESAQRSAESSALIAMMQRITDERPRLWGPSIVGFGRYHYRYDSGRQGDAPLVAFSPRKPALVIYIMTGFAEADALLAKLGPHSTGKSCLYIKALDRVDLSVLEKLVTQSYRAMKDKYHA
ncbi:MAG: DUF1801 domain-containing protein, partial [Beijerinckiaceae bacterium]